MSSTLLLYATWSMHFKRCLKSSFLYKTLLLLLTAIHSLPMVILPFSFEAQAIIVGILAQYWVLAVELRLHLLLEDC